MPTTAAIVTAASAVAGTAVSLSSQQKAKKAQADQAKKLTQLGAQGGADVFGSKPEFNFQEYTPLENQDPGYAGIARRVLQGDIDNLPLASQLSGDINKQISASTRQRIEGWDPTFSAALSTLFKTRNQTLKGRLPYEDALSITSDRTRLANDMGQAGGSSPQVAADLGLKRLDLMTNVGPNLTGAITNILNTVDPINRHTTPEGFLVRPSDAIPWAISDNQFGAQFNMTGELTQAYLDAMPDPAAQGMFNLKAFQAGLGGTNAGSGGQMIQALGSAFQSLAGVNWGKTTGSAPSNTPVQGGSYVGSPYGSNPIYSGANNGPAYYYNNSSWNSIPKAQAVA